MNREKLYDIHNNRIFEIDKLITANEVANGIAGYRKLLLSFAEGLVLETGVGSSNNIRFYPKDKPLAVIGVDYSPNALELAIAKETNDLDIKYVLEDVEK